MRIVLAGKDSVVHHKSANAYRKDILRNIQHGRKRFVAIAAITLLGVMMFSGLQASCEDLRRSADRFFDAQNLHDLTVVSTLGLTDEDVTALEKVSGVKQAEGIYSEEVSTDIDDAAMSVELQTLTESGIDAPYLVEGRLPEEADEAAVTQKFLEDSGLAVGDTFRITEDAQEDSEADTAEESEGSEAGAAEESGGQTDAADDADTVNADSGENEVKESGEQSGNVAEETDTSGSADAGSSTDTNNNIDTDINVGTNIDVDTDVDTDINVDADTEQSAEFLVTEFTITGVVVDPTDVDNPFSAVSYRTDSSAADKAYILKAAVESDYYTEVVLTLTDAAPLECYSDSYEDLVGAVQSDIETNVKGVQEASRTASVRNKAQTKLDDAKATAEEKLAEARQKLEDGQAELDQQLADAEQKLDDGEQQLKDGEQQISEGKQQLADGRGQLDSAQEQLDAQKASAEQQIADGRAQIASGREQLNQQIAAVQAQIDALNAAGDTEQLAQAQAGLAGMQEQLAALDQQEAALNQQEQAAQQQFASAQAEIDAQRKTLEESETELQSNEEKLEESRQELADGWDDYNSGKAEGQQKLSDAWAKYDEGKAEADSKIADAQKEIDDIEDAVWYVQDRMSLSGYSNISSDADSIEAIGTVFPVVFFAVAVLISLTTVARMVDEDRGLFGTYKSLGFTDMEIRQKYLIYAGLACLAGSIGGTLMAFLGLPTFIFTVFHVMYLLPEYGYSFVPAYGISGPVLFFAGVLLATWAACRKELAETPASLMRPRSPRAGSRVLLERVTPVWKRMSFLNKVTARNLFRYKGRLFMTIFGIGGCMALLLFGFSIRDSVADLRPREYDQTLLYDVMAVASPDDNDKLLSYVEDDPQVKDYVNAEITSVKLSVEDAGESETEDSAGTAGASEDSAGDVNVSEDSAVADKPGGSVGADSRELSVQLIVVPDGTDLSSYISLKPVNRRKTVDISGANSDGESLSLAEGDIYFTRNAANVLDFSDGDSVSMQLPDLQKSVVPVTAVVENYLSNYVFMTQSTFEQYYDAFEPDAVLLHLSDSCADPVGWADDLAAEDGVISSVSIQKLKDQFSGTFQLMNMVVAIVILMSAALAFVVLFTLSTTNISERVRELATIKVLGFYDREVHAYVNKETWILTAIGIVLGIPLGRLFAQSLTVILNLPSIYLAVSLHVTSYLYAAGLTVLFALLVSLMTNRTLDRIDPATALKSVE